MSKPGFCHSTKLQSYDNIECQEYDFEYEYSFHMIYYLCFYALSIQS